MRDRVQNTSRLWYLNSGFDLELSGELTHHLHGAIAQMTHWFIPAAAPGDFVLVDLPTPADFLDYLSGIGLAPARSVVGNAPSGLSGEAWGWSESSVERLLTQGAEVCHPPLGIVREVNSRAFCHKIGVENDLGTPGAYLESDPARLLDENPRRSTPSYRGPIVIKAMHSNAGRAMTVHRRDQWSAKQVSFLKKLSACGHAVVVEPWLQRVADISTMFYLNASGQFSRAMHYWTLIGPDGHCAGDFIEPGTEDFEKWNEALARSMEVAGRELSLAGYFGPVGLDHFLYKSRQEIKLAAMVDINARHTLGSLAVALQGKLNPKRPLLLRLISRKKHRLPGDYDSLKKLLGDLWWSRQRGQGVILLTALRIKSGGAIVQPARSLFCIQAEDRGSLRAMYSQLLVRIGNKLDTRVPFELIDTR